MCEMVQDRKKRGGNINNAVECTPKDADTKKVNSIDSSIPRVRDRKPIETQEAEVVCCCVLGINEKCRP